MRECRQVHYCGADRGEERRVHLAALDTSRSLCGSVSFDGSPFDEWQRLEDSEPEGDVDGERCFPCWEAWETRKRADRERHGEYVPAQRDYVRAPRRKVSPQVASQRIANRAADPVQPRADVPPELIRLYKAELLEMGTPEALAELERRKRKRAEKRAARREAIAA